MAVHYVQGSKSNPLGTLGAVTSLAGTLAGVPWLVPVGMGMGMLGGIASGQGVSAQDIARMAGSMNGAAGTSEAENPASAANNPAAQAASQSQYPAWDFVNRWQNIQEGVRNGRYRSSL